MTTTDRSRSDDVEHPGTAIIVGAGPGIGASVANRFAEAGYAVGLVARNRERLAEMERDLTHRTGASVRAETADATDVRALKRALGRSSRTWANRPPCASVRSPTSDSSSR